MCSIFRLFSADRKRVETALENCNLPSGRVRQQNIEIPPSLPLFTSPLLLMPLFLISVSELFLLLHPSITPDCCSVHLFGVLFSGCVHGLPLRTDVAVVVMTQMDPVGAIEMTKAVFISTSVRYHPREGVPSCSEVSTLPQHDKQAPYYRQFACL